MRRAIFERLADGPLSAGEIARGLLVTPAAVSRHLKALEDAGLVVDRAVGNRHLCQRNANGVGTMRADLGHLWTRALAGFKAAVEAPADDTSDQERD
jgi:DNA-binding transcriptional ArsR family regulator